MYFSTRESYLDFSLPDYGLDAPELVKRWGILGALSLVVSIILSNVVPSSWLSVLVLIVFYGVSFSYLVPATTITIGSLFLKFWDRDWLFENIPLKGDETVLDVGCGRGLLLVGAAKRLTSGIAHGLDCWVQADQSDNRAEATLENAALESVQEKVRVHDGDMRQMPFPDEMFDVVVSSWAVHNISSRMEREKALQEMVRVLKPGGRLGILDIEHARAYSEYLTSNGLNDVKLLGPHWTFGNRTYLVTATKS